MTKLELIQLLRGKGETYRQRTKFTLEETLKAQKRVIKEAVDLGFGVTKEEAIEAIAYGYTNIGGVK